MRNNEFIIDSGFFLALLFIKDPYHHQATALFEKIEKRKWVTTWPVVTEVCHLLLKRRQHRQIPTFLQTYEKGGFEIFPITLTHTPKIIEVIEKYKTLPADLADASLIILAEELGHGDIISTDYRDFNTYRWKNHKPFNNLFDLKE